MWHNTACWSRLKIQFALRKVQATGSETVRARKIAGDVIAVDQNAGESGVHSETLSFWNRWLNSDF
jgi:hypothetical protein